MNSMESVAKAVEVLRGANALLIVACTSMYPTPYDKVRLGGLDDMREAFPNAVLGLSDHSLGPDKFRRYPVWGATLRSISLGHELAGAGCTYIDYADQPVI